MRVGVGDNVNSPGSHLMNCSRVVSLGVKAVKKPFFSPLTNLEPNEPMEQYQNYTPQQSTVWKERDI
jgi:hypothetical protein